MINRGPINLRYKTHLVFFLLFISVSQLVPADEYSDTPIKNKRVEFLVYADINRYMDSINNLCSKFDVDPSIVVAILYSEKIQYELDVFRKGKRRLERLVSTFPDFMSNLYTWSQLTAGYTHIKETFALETKNRLDKTEKYNGFLSSTDIEPSSYISSPIIALSITVAGLAMLSEEWSNAPLGCDISDMPEILATLYNIGYVNSRPHRSPEPGGSIMPIIIDGYIISGYSFGDRVKLLIEESEAFKAFIEKSISS